MRDVAYAAATLEELTRAAEREWIDKWTEGPTELSVRCLVD